MAYSKENIEKIFKEIISDIESGLSLRKSLNKKGRPSNEVFYKWIDSNEDKVKLYARACESRADSIFEEILEISNHTEEDHTPFTGSNVIQRDKLKIDARKWMLSKMNPKKYGDKIDHTTDGEKITGTAAINIEIIPPSDDD